MSQTHPLWCPFEKLEMEDVDKAAIGGESARIVDGIAVVAPQESWHDDFLYLKKLVADALGDTAIAIEHIGSTAVTNLYAKAIIDIDVLVADASHEVEYVQALEQKGFAFTIREPEWQEHRMFEYPKPACNLHVFSEDSIEYRRHIAFRDWLNEHADDRQLYGDLKRSLAQRQFDSMAAYNNEKAELIYNIYERIFAADTNHTHDPQPLLASHSLRVSSR